MAAILLPQSILTSDSKYEKLRKFILCHFRIKAMLLTADITFYGTTTSPVTLFMEKKSRPAFDIDYQTMFIFSDKYRDIRVKKDKEIRFLGYKFSTNKNSPSICCAADGGLLNQQIQPVLAEFLQGRIPALPKDGSCVIKPIRSVIINSTKQIFPRFEERTSGKPLREFFDIVEKLAPSSDDAPYLEIGDITNGVIERNNAKNNKGVLCRQGDVLLSTLTPSAEKICLAQTPYTVSNAIAVLRVKDKYKSLLHDLVKDLKSHDAIQHMNTMTVRI